jgi:type I restriction enzyme M protein
MTHKTSVRTPRLFNYQLSLTELESHLWEAANILRGPVDAADFKTYIFPLLFFKRISDVYEEERARALADSDGDEAYADHPETHVFDIPKGCRWNDIRAKSVNIGVALDHALRKIEIKNKDRLQGIFGDAQWTNKDRLSDELLSKLLDHFSELNLSNEHARTDMLGQAYEYLIKKFADSTNKKAGEFYTPRSVVRLMINILDPQPSETIYDPACGTGGMLLEAVNHVREAGDDPRTMLGKLFGQEKNLTTSSIARMNLYLHGIEDFDIRREDTLRRPAFYEGDVLKTFDGVIANPPFSLEKWGEDKWPDDPFGRHKLGGVPPQKSGDYAWVQHMLKSMTPRRGRMAVVLPHGALFRGGAEGNIRKAILKDDWLEAVIGLGPNLFYGTGLAACILVFRAVKSKGRVGKVLIVDASKLFRKGRNQNTLEPEHAEQILNAFRKFRDIANLARVVTLADIEQQEWNLNISRYVEPNVERRVLTLEQATANLETALHKAYQAEDRLAALMRESGLMQ